MQLDLLVTRSTVFDYGVATRGQIDIGGNVKLTGLPDPELASVLSCYDTAGNNAINIHGGPVVSGDLYTSGLTADVTVGGGPVIGGEADPTKWSEHIHRDIGVPDFPVIDTSELITYATTVVNKNDLKVTGLETSVELSNIIIPAGLNPVVTNDVTLNGVIYIQSPNTVKFTANATINGIIITEDDPSQDFNKCSVEFAGGVQLNGVGVLGPDYGELRDHKGTFIVAPSFSLKFGGHTESVGGVIAADQITFGGGTTGIVRGSVIGLKDLLMGLDGGCEITISPMEDENPAGFEPVIRLAPDRTTYTEELYSYSFHQTSVPSEMPTGTY